MSIKTTMAGFLYKAVSSGAITFHDAIKWYALLNSCLAKKLSPSGRASSKCTLNYMKTATDPNSNKMWTSVAFPAEILVAFDIYPLTLEVMAGTFASLGLARHFLDVADSNDIPNTMCSFHRLLLGIAEDGILGKPLAVGATSIFCDGNVKSFAEAAAIQNVPFIFIDIPYESGNEATVYVKKQLETAMNQLADLSGVKNYQERFMRVVKNVNETLPQLKNFYDIRRSAGKNLYRGHEIVNYCFSNHFMLGRKILLDLMHIKNKDVKTGNRRHKRFKTLFLNENVKRLMWLHIVPQYDSPIWDVLDDGINAKVICDEYSSVCYKNYDINDPLRSIAERLIDHPSNGPLNRRADHIIKVAGDFKVDGIVHYSSWGCHQAAGNIHLLAEKIKEAGFKFLNLNGDAVDVRNSSAEQHRTRAEAFLESL